MSIPIIDVVETYQGGFTARRIRTDHIVIHHAKANYPPGIAAVQSVARYHIKTKGWPGIAYHTAIAREANGKLTRYKLSDPATIRAHVAHRNPLAYGICLLADLTNRAPLADELDALAEAAEDTLRLYPQAQIVGHKDIALGPQESPDGLDWRTDCPGKLWLTWKPLLLAKVAALQHPQDNEAEWALWGCLNPPTDDARSHALPQLWFANRHWLGAALTDEYEPTPGLVLQVWQGGMAYYLKATKRACLAAPPFPQRLG